MEKRRKVALDAAIYKRPAEGSPESADPFFVARVRGCGRCGMDFTTTAKFRFLCPGCRGQWKSAKPEVRELRAGVGNRFVSSE